MNTLIIDRKHSRVYQERGVLKVEIDGEKPRSIPISQIERVVVSSDIQLQSRLLSVLASQNIGLVVINPRRPDESGVLIGNGHGDAERRIRQFRASEDDAFCTRFARELVKHKVSGQKALLEQKRDQRPEHRKRLSDAIDTLNRASTRLSNDPLNVNSIRGIEGAGAAAYFQGYSALFPLSMHFNHRNRRPPRDPVNALLSLSYTLGHSLGVYLLQRRGFETLIGFYHRASYSRPSLSSDIIEPVRPTIDEWVLEMVNSQQLRAEHFRNSNGGCLLDKSGRRTFYKCWETEMKSKLIEQLNEVIKQMMQMLGEKDSSLGDDATTTL